jgi:Flp pilus assembly protein TadG
MVLSIICRHSGVPAAPRHPAGRHALYDARGIAALEFAIVAPVLLLMLIGMVCFGAYLVYLHELQELASSAARASIAGLNEAERDSLAKQFVSSAISNSVLLRAADLTVTTATSGSPPVYYAVTLAYSLNDTPIPLLAGFVNFNAAAITRTSTVQFGNY